MKKQSKNICGIYKITSPSGKLYIGQTINFRKRINFYSGLFCYGQRALYYSIKKHGWSKHEIEMIHECHPDQLDFLEVFYIGLYDTLNSKHGMNLREGGNRVVFSKTSIEKMRLSHLGSKNHFFGKTHSKETIDKIISKTRGMTAWNKGLTDIYSKESVSAMTLNQPKIKQIGQYDLDGNLLKIWNSSSELNKATGFDRRFIKRVCSNKKSNKTAYGFKWSY